MSILKPIHPQVNTSLGFSCDKDIVELIEALHRTRFRLSTDASCQSWHLHHSGAKWPKSRGYVSIRGMVFNDLLEFGLALQASRLDTTKFGYAINIDVWTKLLGPRAYLHFTTDPKFVEQMVEVIKSL